MTGESGHQSEFPKKRRDGAHPCAGQRGILQRYPKRLSAAICQPCIACRSCSDGGVGLQPQASSHVAATTITQLRQVHVQFLMCDGYSKLHKMVPSPSTLISGSFMAMSCLSLFQRRPTFLYIDSGMYIARLISSEPKTSHVPKPPRRPGNFTRVRIPSYCLGHCLSQLVTLARYSACKKKRVCKATDEIDFRMRMAKNGPTAARPSNELPFAVSFPTSGGDYPCVLLINSAKHSFRLAEMAILQIAYND